MTLNQLSIKVNLFNCKNQVTIMEWTDDAEALIKKVPFFVRKKVRARVENEASEAGKHMVTLEDVKGTQARFISKMSSEIKGYQVENCFGTGGCPNKTFEAVELVNTIEEIFKKEALLSFLKQRVKGSLKFHHEFRVTFAECPNACSQPQIKDIGIIGAIVPFVTHEECTECGACIEACKEKCIVLNHNTKKPDIDFRACLYCGQCIKKCPTGTIQKKNKGFRIQLGGKLGRHPRLALELNGIFSENQVIDIVKYCIRFYRDNSRHGERFSTLLDEEAFEKIQAYAYEKSN